MQQEMKLRGPYMTREERLDQLYDILSRAGVPLTFSQVCQRAGLARSGYVLGMLHELQQGGDLDVFVIPSHRPLPTKYYAWIDQSADSQDYSEQVQAHVNYLRVPFVLDRESGCYVVESELPF